MCNFDKLCIHVQKRDFANNTLLLDISPSLVFLMFLRSCFMTYAPQLPHSPWKCHGATFLKKNPFFFGWTHLLTQLQLPSLVKTCKFELPQLICLSIWICLSACLFDIYSLMMSCQQLKLNIYNKPELLAFFPTIFPLSSLTFHYWQHHPPSCHSILQPRIHLSFFSPHTLDLLQTLQLFLEQHYKTWPFLSVGSLTPISFVDYCNFFPSDILYMLLALLQSIYNLAAEIIFISHQSDQCYLSNSFKCCTGSLFSIAMIFVSSPFQNPSWLCPFLLMYSFLLFCPPWQVIPAS